MPLSVRDHADERALAGTRDTACMEPGHLYRWTVQPDDAWRLLTEPMDYEEARTAASAINGSLPHVQALPVDPREYLLLAWDRASVEMMVEALGAIADAGRPVPPGILTNLRGWLAKARPYNADDDRWPDSFQS